MPKKKQQTIEATLGRPRMKVPKVRAPVKGSSNIPEDTVVPSSPNGPRSWSDTAKAHDSHRSPVSRAPRFSPSSTFMPRSGGRKAQAADSSTSAAETSGLDDDQDTPMAKKASLPKQAASSKGTKKKQSRLATGFGKLGIGSSPRSAVVVDDDKSSDDMPLATPRASSNGARGKHFKPTALSNETDDDVPLATPKASKQAVTKYSKRPVTADNSDDDDDDLPLVTPKSSRGQQSRKRLRRALPSDNEDDDDVVLPSTKRRRFARRRDGNPSDSESDSAAPADPPPTSSPVKRKAGGRHKDKRRLLELLRRRRAGENIDSDDMSASSDEGEHRALYDTDSDHVALEEFEDDEEGVPEPQPLAKGKKTKKGSKKDKSDDKRRDKGKQVDTGASNSDDNDEDGNLAGFVETDDEGLLGVPGELLDIPLQFTSQSHRPLRDHFRQVVLWLVKFKFDRNFGERRDEIYLMAWRKLDDEVRGLANSKFASSAWKPDFNRALHARPTFVAHELSRGDLRELTSCEACGRSGHPATWVVQFTGAAYYRKNTAHEHFLEDVESDSDDESEDHEEEPDRDEDNNDLAPESKEWSLGAVCKSNAETAHELTHWKHHLLEWVSDKLENEGLMTPAQIAARSKMKRKHMRNYTEAIVERWDGERVVESLYRDFKGVLEEARNKSTTGKGGGRWGRG